MDDNLQKLIKQSNFKSPYQKAHVGMVYLCNWLENYQQEFFKQYEISAQQFNILRILRGRYPEPCNINLLKERMLFKMSDVSRLITRLKKAGLVDRATNKADKRETHIHITEKALEILRKIDTVEDNLFAILNELNEEEIGQFNHLIDRILDAKVRTTVENGNGEVA
jgi:DNA-binding MarR family transcriptional regulator